MLRATNRDGDSGRRGCFQQRQPVMLPAASGVAASGRWDCSWRQPAMLPSATRCCKRPPSEVQPANARAGSDHAGVFSSNVDVAAMGDGGALIEVLPREWSSGKRTCAAIVATGEQVSGTTRPCEGEGELGFWEELFITGRLPSKSGGAAYRRLQRRLLRPVAPVVNNVVINNVAATSSATPPRHLHQIGSELYIMESFHDIRMVNNRSVVEQAHEIQCIAKELELLKCALPDKFVAGCIIAKLPPSWRNFATTLKHKRQEISVENLIASLDVEEKARAKDTTEKGEGQSSANMVQKKPYSKNKGNNKPSFNKPMKTTTFKKKKMINKADLSCFTCGDWPLF
ncbi:hypothetical protein QYE76_001045 [Lolium multiflorum]|uniref:Gag-pol polyprotein n=1 Tax=Lolium multiflorum TaxID=4521 RepID=A0AAD8VWJ3_LOLMU|nr:hypothetical protein QYE76_001045 [Lolium multiflorum]